jgi:rubrerythrin
VKNLSIIHLYFVNENLPQEVRTMPTTLENIKDAFAGESQASQKYRAFAKKAEREGFPNVACLFRTAAEAERIHAEGHLNAMEAICSTVENLQAAINGETYEFKEMYPPMLEQATADEHKARRMFGYALEAEAVHARLYSLALEAVKQDKDLTGVEFYLCPVCGNIELGKPTEACPICGAKSDKFILV